MDQVVYWLDLGGWLVMLKHAWIWACLSATLAFASVFGIAAVARHYDNAGADLTGYHQA